MCTGLRGVADCKGRQGEKRCTAIPVPFRDTACKRHPARENRKELARRRNGLRKRRPCGDLRRRFPAKSHGEEHLRPTRLIPPYCHPHSAALTQAQSRSTLHAITTPGRKGNTRLRLKQFLTADGFTASLLQHNSWNLLARTCIELAEPQHKASPCGGRTLHEPGPVH